MSELWQLGALELADGSGPARCRAVRCVEAHLARVDEVNPHAQRHRPRLDDEALAAADAADAAVAAGGELGVFHGVPITVKENIDLAGTPTTQGIAALADAIADDRRPRRSSGCARPARSRSPARTCPTSGCASTPTPAPRPHPQPPPPGRTAGGSSGGEASAIASGMSPLGLGNDIGGSLRNPAHCCGIASIKPSVGVVPMATVVPPEDLLSRRS
jgi:amidase